ncbi:MAG: ketosteroid isomerase-like protein [Ramlibacter sp.]|jgi:ketosteroid isomerase-like protein|nr:ketosteroid isomerase-like protein [Ramlibacter sp.]
MQDNKLTQVVRAYFGAYESENRAVAEALLADDFRFTSPNDDSIDKATYFERCWPHGEPSRDQRIESIVVEGQKAYVTYLCADAGGKSFRNTEFLTFSGERIASVNVYFGPAYQDGVFV